MNTDLGHTNRMPEHISEAYQICAKEVNPKCYVNLTVAVAKHFDMYKMLHAHKIRPSLLKVFETSEVKKAI